MSYTPNPPPENLTVQAVWDEFQKLRNFIEVMEVETIRLRVLHVAPSKPQEARIYYADGTDWNPGSGKGIYQYDGSSYNKL